jgi:osmotically-inducible protein OsmY
VLKNLRLGDGHTMRQCIRFGLMVVLLASNACGGERYQAMIDNAETRLTDLMTVDDQMYQRRLRDALDAHPEFSSLTLSTYVFMGRGYVIGYVDSHEQAKAVFNTAASVKGLRSLDAYLPIKRTSSNDMIGNSNSDAIVKANLESALGTEDPAYRWVHVEVLDGRVVLVGVIPKNEDRIRVEGAAAGTSGVKHVSNWLLLPETEYMAIRSQF